jgi:hypothetical protein
MQLQLLLNDDRQKLWIDRLQREITKNQAELDKELPSFLELEKDYLSWKSKVDAIKSAINNDKSDLNDLIHAQNFPENKVHKPRLVNAYTKEEVQKQVVQKMKGYDKDGLKALPNIKWASTVSHVMKEPNRFISYKELFAILAERKIIPGDSVTLRRFYVAMSTTRNHFKSHNKLLGLLIWFDENGVPKQEYLNNFIGTKQAV